MAVDSRRRRRREAGVGLRPVRRKRRGGRRNGRHAAQGVRRRTPPREVRRAADTEVDDRLLCRRRGSTCPGEVRRRRVCRRSRSCLTRRRVCGVRETMYLLTPLKGGAWTSEEGLKKKKKSGAKERMT